MTATGPKENPGDSDAAEIRKKIVAVALVSTILLSRPVVVRQGRDTRVDESQNAIDVEMHCVSENEADLVDCLHHPYQDG